MDCDGEPGVSFEAVPHEGLPPTGDLGGSEEITLLADVFVQDHDATRLLTARAWKRANDLPREAFEDQILFANPALNILLDLYISERGRIPVNVSSACYASSAPPTTALRYITRLVELGFVKRSNDARDQRVNFLSLTQEGMSRMVRLLDGVTASNGRLDIGRLNSIK